MLVGGGVFYWRVTIRLNAHIPPDYGVHSPFYVPFFILSPGCD